MSRTAGCVYICVHAVYIVYICIICLYKPSRYVTATEVNSAFYPLWDGKMSMSFQAE